MSFAINPTKRNKPKINITKYNEINEKLHTLKVNKDLTLTDCITYTRRTDAAADAHEPSLAEQRQLPARLPAVAVCCIVHDIILISYPNLESAQLNAVVLLFLYSTMDARWLLFQENGTIDTKCLFVFPTPANNQMICNNAIIARLIAILTVNKSKVTPKM